MKEFIEFIMVDGPALTFPNLVAFFAFCVAFASLVIIIQAVMSSGNYR